MDVNCILVGILAFLLFILYDINSVIMKNKLLSCFFFAGFLLLITATIGIIIVSRDKIHFNALRMGSFGGLAMFFLFLLIYTLFFALPFQDTYVNKNFPPKVCQTGVYALCRHPGVLWFIGFYLSFGLAIKSSLFLLAAVVFSTLNIFYVIFQDRWTFIRTFSDYKRYKMDTPFLIPNTKSIKRCFKTL